MGTHPTKKSFSVRNVKPRGRHYISAFQAGKHRVSSNRRSGNVIQSPFELDSHADTIVKSMWGELCYPSRHQQGWRRNALHRCVRQPRNWRDFHHCFQRIIMDGRSDGTHLDESRSIAILRAHSTRKPVIIRSNFHIN
jgi:hypothetical protein